jgi:galactokinase
LCLRNIVPEIGFLQKSAKSLGALGATGFGAGFGGSCYAVAKTHNCSEFMNKWREEYHRNYPHFIQKAQFDEYPACCGCYWEIFNGE